MTGLVVVALGASLVGAVGVVVAGGRGRAVTVAAALAAAAGWTLVAAADTPAELGGMSFDAVLAAALAGTSLLVAAHPPASTLGRGAALCVAPVLAAAAGSGGDGIPDRPLAAGVLAVAVLAAVTIRADGETKLTAALPPLVGSAAVAVGASISTADRAAPIVLVGAGVVLLGALAPTVPGRLALPAVLLAVARIVPAGLGDSVDPVDPDLAAGVAGAVAGVVAIGYALASRRRPIGADRLGLLALAAAVALFGAGLDGAAGAGHLAAAAGTLCLAAAHPLALVALLPAVVAAPTALAAATEPGHAAIGTALVVLVVVGALRPPTIEPTAGPALSQQWPVGLALVFGVVPLWGWSGAAPADLVPGLVTAAAFALLAAVSLTALAARDAGTLTLRRAPTASSDGRTQQDLPLDGAQGNDPVEGQVDVPEAT